MWLPGARGQQNQSPLYDASITMTGSAQLVLGRSQSRSFLLLQNNGAHAMAIGIGFGKATCALTSGVVTSVSVTNAGFGYTKPPLVRFLGGGYPGGAPGGIGYNTSFIGLAQPNAAAPSNFAQGTAVLSGGAIGSITINNGGANYDAAPFVQVLGSDLDPNGAILPAVAGYGYQLSNTAPQNVLTFQNTFCPTDPVSVIGTSGDVLHVWWAE